MTAEERQNVISKAKVSVIDNRIRASVRKIARQMLQVSSSEKSQNPQNSDDIYYKAAQQILGLSYDSPLENDDEIALASIKALVSLEMDLQREGQAALSDLKDRQEELIQTIIKRANEVQQIQEDNLSSTSVAVSCSSNSSQDELPIADATIYVTLANLSYDKARLHQGGFETLKDSPREFRKDQEQFTRGLNELGIQRSEVRRYVDLSYEELKALLSDLKIEIIQNQGAGKKTLLIFHYSGHAVIRVNSTHIIINEEGEKFRFPLEKKLRALADLANSHVLSLLDCCR